MGKSRVFTVSVLALLLTASTVFAQSLRKQEKQDGKMPSLEPGFTKANQAVGAGQQKLVDKAAVMEGAASTSIYDQDGNGKVNYSDAAYLFNHMNTLTVAEADLNNNNRIDFADVTTLYSRVGQVRQAFDINKGGGGIDYRVKNDGQSLTTSVAAMGLHSSPYSLNYATGDISYNPYPVPWNSPSGRVTVTKNDPARYTELAGIMTNTVNNVLKNYDAGLTTGEKTQLNNSLGIIADLTRIQNQAPVDDIDGSGKFDMGDVTYLFNNMSTLTVARADFNGNNRIDFGDVTTLYNKLQGANKSYDITVHWSGLNVDYQVKSDGSSLTAGVAGKYEFTMNLTTGNISYNDKTGGVVTVDKTGDSVQYAALAKKMSYVVNEALLRGTNLTDSQKSQLNGALESISKFSALTLTSTIVPQVEGTGLPAGTTKEDIKGFGTQDGKETAMQFFAGISGGTSYVGLADGQAIELTSCSLIRTIDGSPIDSVIRKRGDGTLGIYGTVEVLVFHTRAINEGGNYYESYKITSNGEANIRMPAIF